MEKDDEKHDRFARVGELDRRLGAQRSPHGARGVRRSDFRELRASQFPEATNACLDIVTREGKQYAHFKGEIVSVSGSQVRARFKLPNGQYSQTYAFTPKSGSRIRSPDSPTASRSCRKGRSSTFTFRRIAGSSTVPETDSFAAAPTVETYRVTTVTVGSLPHTASEVPLVGLLSVVLLALGTGLTLIRRRLS